MKANEATAVLTGLLIVFGLAALLPSMTALIVAVSLLMIVGIAAVIR